MQCTSQHIIVNFDVQFPIHRFCNRKWACTQQLQGSRRKGGSSQAYSFMFSITHCILNFWSSRWRRAVGPCLLRISNLVRCPQLEIVIEMKWRASNLQMLAVSNSWWACAIWKAVARSCDMEPLAQLVQLQSITSHCLSNRWNHAGWMSTEQSHLCNSCWNMSTDVK